MLYSGSSKILKEGLQQSSRSQTPWWESLPASRMALTRQSFLFRDANWMLVSVNQCKTRWAQNMYYKWKFSEGRDAGYEKMLLSECGWPLCCFSMEAHLASNDREMVAMLLLSSTLAEGDYGKQFPSVKDTQGVILRLMATLCFSEPEFLPGFLHRGNCPVIVCSGWKIIISSRSWRVHIGQNKLEETKMMVAVWCWNTEQQCSGTVFLFYVDQYHS